MTPEQIAEDVARRYGLPVAPGAVKIIPQGMTSMKVEYVWVPSAVGGPKDGGQLKPIEQSKNRSWKRQIKAEADQAKRRKHNNVAKANETRIRICVERVEKVRALADRGLTAREIAAALNDDPHTLRAFMRRHKIEFRRAV